MRSGKTAKSQFCDGCQGFQTRPLPTDERPNWLNIAAASDFGATNGAESKCLLGPIAAVPESDTGIRHRTYSLPVRLVTNQPIWPILGFQITANGRVGLRCDCETCYSMTRANSVVIGQKRNAVS